MDLVVRRLLKADIHYKPGTYHRAWSGWKGAGGELVGSGACPDLLLAVSAGSDPLGAPQRSVYGLITFSRRRASTIHDEMLAKFFSMDSASKIDEFKVYSPNHVYCS